MKIAIIGTGNVGGALATRWALAGHDILLAVQDIHNFKGKDLLRNARTQVMGIEEATALAECILIATPPQAVTALLPQTGLMQGKIVIDSTNNVFQRWTDYPTAFHFLNEHTQAELVKCFNTTGFENILDPVYGTEPLDMFMAGDSERAKAVASQLALDCGFGTCIDFGKSDKVQLLEQFATSWINLAIMQGMGRDIAFKVVHRN